MPLRPPPPPPNIPAPGPTFPGVPPKLTVPIGVLLKPALSAAMVATDLPTVAMLDIEFGIPRPANPAAILPTRLAGDGPLKETPGPGPMAPTPTSATPWVP